jgi:UDP-N-acetylmuramoylalanine--D-glutamate ligase
MKLSEYMNELKNKKVTVVGIGISNRPLIKLLRKYDIDVTARDKQTREKLGATAETLEGLGVKLILGEDYLKNIDADVIFRSPGIRPDIPEFTEAIEKGAVLTSEMEAFFEVCPCKIIAITGSDGKTTTTTVISEILKNDGKNVYVGGNIGTPLLDKADEMKESDVCVLELSSFQLMTIRKSPDVAVITNLAPNHLDIHKGMEEYIDAKKNIFINDPQPVRVVLNYDNDITRSFIPEVKNEVSLFSMKEKIQNGVYLKDGKIISVKDGSESVIMEKTDIFIPGEHNVENYMAAFAALSGIAGTQAMVETAKNFKGVEHRIEFVR